ncbi:hypothetical protein [Pseudonocardia parietis]|uniref:Ig-like domain-containing protein n=1 Tax=Pseudonocardia parietis TaxID=570936 RepID=A0ABS4W1Y0_9PSEU|nr:hypothetical protein [Pseudonocardia parietis]MBP2370202.1 hypothetical protein [Pseudonocardia parietis]
MPPNTQRFTTSDGTFVCTRDDGSPATAPTYSCTQQTTPAEPSG